LSLLFLLAGESTTKNRREFKILVYQSLKTPLKGAFFNWTEPLKNAKIKLRNAKKTMRILTKIYSMTFYVIKRLLSLLEIFLFLRLLLKFLSANPQTLIVKLIYEYSDILVSPFNFIFHDIYWPTGYFIETATISAMIGYALAVFIIFFLLRLFSKD
jgi:hypothetical protein